MKIAESLSITPEMLKIITEIDTFKNQWHYDSKLNPERFTKLKKVATIESVGSSNRIEGNRLSDSMVENLLSGLGKQSFKNRDEQEVAGYAELMELIFENYEVLPLSENYIKQFHSILLKYSTKDVRHRGQYKTVDNSVAAFSPDGKEIGVVFQTSSAFDTPMQMEELVFWLRNNIEDGYYHPLLVIGIFIVHFLAIHPFQDGNGRLSRALTQFLLLKTGYTYTPYCSMEAIIESNKNGYYRSLRQTQQTLNSDCDYTDWLMFFLRTMQKQVFRLKFKIAEIDKDSVNFVQNEVKPSIIGEGENLYEVLPPLSVRIINLARKNPQITASFISQSLNENQNTVKKHLQSLCQKEYLVKHGSTKSCWYTVL